MLDQHRKPPPGARKTELILVGKTIASLRRERVAPVAGLVQPGSLEPGSRLAAGTPVAHLKPDPPSGAGNLIELAAPIAGHLLWVSPGLRPDGHIAAGAPAFVVGQLDPLLIRAQVHEEEALRLAPGDPATVHPESLPGERFPAQVSRVAWTPLSLDPLQPSFYEVELTMTNPNARLREGMRVILEMHKPMPTPPPAPPVPQ